MYVVSFQINLKVLAIRKGSCLERAEMAQLSGGAREKLRNTLERAGVEYHRGERRRGLASDR